MRARKLAAKAATLACALIVGLLFVSGSACAAVTHNLLSTFGSFSSVQGVAVDQSTGDVYVYDAGAGKVFKFDASGAPVNFSSTGTNAIEGVGGAGEAEDEIAVDNSAGSAKGDIYVANGSHVGIYGADGKSLGELTEEAGKPWGKPCGVAVDPSGSVYVGLYPEHVNKYTPAANPVVDADYVSSLWKLNSVCNVVVDSAGSLYADSWSEGPVTKYEALQFSLIETPASGSEVPGSGRSIAVDTATDPVTKTADDLYVGRYTEVAQFEPAGGLI
ncbi:MAG TPA: hypothetical protein VFV03_02215, partial [Solirubrobacteraceae bacterium]|nr:hypothetical protein [Solirubrobacteraceae bacterium]